LAIVFEPLSASSSGSRVSDRNRYHWMLPRVINSDLINDLARRLGTSDLLNWIETRTAELARLGWKRPGFVDLGPRLLAEVGVAGCIADMKIADLATIRPQETQSYVIHHHYFRTRPYGSVEDHRFWVAHELSHTFWFSAVPGGLPLSSHQKAIGSDPTIEWLCNRAAAALLVPRGLLEALLREEGYNLRDDPPPLHLIPNFARKLRVAPRLLARRWFHDILSSPRNVLCIEPTPRSHEKDHNTTRFRILWEAIFSGSTKLPRKLQGRVVRFKYQHNDDLVRTIRHSLDGRWLELIAQAHTPSQKAIPFSQLPSRPPIAAELARVGKSVILSFSWETSPSS